MAESLERCFSRALLKHFPAEDGDTDEEFHVNSEDRDRKDKKKSKSHKQSGPESLIRATEQVQKRKTSNSGKGNNQQQDKPKSALQYPPPHYTNGPPHPHNIHLGQQQGGMLHPAQQVRLHSLHTKKVFVVDRRDVTVWKFLITIIVTKIISIITVLLKCAGDVQ